MSIFTSLSSYGHRFRSGMKQDPVSDWLALLTLSTLALVAIIFWNVWLFNTVAQGGSIGAAATSTPAVFNSSSIGVITNVFQMRAVQEQKYITGVYRYTDPSQ